MMVVLFALVMFVALLDTVKAYERCEGCIEKCKFKEWTHVDLSLGLIVHFVSNFSISRPHFTHMLQL